MTTHNMATHNMLTVLKAAFDEACKTTSTIHVLAFLLSTHSVGKTSKVTPAEKLAQCLMDEKKKLDSPALDFLPPETRARHLENIIMRYGYYPRPRLRPRRRPTQGQDAWIVP